MRKRVRFSDLSGMTIKPGEGAILIVLLGLTEPAIVLDVTRQEAEDFIRRGRPLIDAIADRSLRILS